MLALKDRKCKNNSNVTVKIEENNKVMNDEENYEHQGYSIVNDEILRTELLSGDYNGDIEYQEDNMPEFISMNSEMTNESTVSSWELRPNSSPLYIVPDSEFTSESTVSDSEFNANSSSLFVTSIPDAKEFIIVTHIEQDTELTSKELNGHSVDDKRSKSDCYKQQNKVVLLKTIVPRYEPIIEIKEEEYPVISGDIDEYVPTVEEIDYQESCIEQDTDSTDSISSLPNFKPLPLFYPGQSKSYIKCPACSAMFTTPNSFKNHLFNHIYKEGDTLACSFCNYTNTEADMLFAHLSKHQDQCEICNENLMRKNNLEKHRGKHMSNFSIKRDRKGRFVCALCKLVFDLVPQLEKHWFKHTCRRQKTYQCKDCSGLYDSRKTLNNHKCMKCPVCDKVCDSLQGLRAHTMWRKHSLKCSICLYEFVFTIDHETHMALHKQTYQRMEDFEYVLQEPGGKTYQCKLCDKIFYALSSIVLHVRDEHSIIDFRHRASNANNYNGNQTRQQIIPVETII